MSIRESILQCRSTIVTVHGIAITCFVTAMTWHRQAGLSHPSRNRELPCFAVLFYICVYVDGLVYTLVVDIYDGVELHPIVEKDIASTSIR